MARRLLVMSVLLLSLAGCVAPHPDSTGIPDPEPARPGSALVFQWAVGSRDAIWTTASDGADAAPLTLTPAGTALHPDPSPDGSRIAVAIDDASDIRSIWIAPVDGGTASLLVGCEPDACLSLDFPAWSHDGRAIVYTHYDGPPVDGPPVSSSIRVIDVESGASTTIAQSSGGQVFDNARWSADDQTIVMQIDQFDGTGTETGLSVATVPAAGGAVTEITDPSMFGGYPDFSPVDPGLIVFCTFDLGPFSETSEASDVYTIRADGSGLTQLTDLGAGGARATQPAFSAAGDRVLVTLVTVGGRELAIVDLEGGEPQATGVPGTHFRPLGGGAPAP